MGAIKIKRKDNKMRMEENYFKQKRAKEIEKENERERKEDAKAIRWV